MQKRQAATPRGLERRVKDLNLKQLNDPRVAASVGYPLPTILTALIAGMVSKAGSLRDTEKRTDQIAAKQGPWLGLQGRIPDNTLGAVLPRVDREELIGRLHDAVKAEQRRGNLKPTVLKQGTVAIDGKHTATLHWHDLCRVLELDKATATPEEVKNLLGKAFPAAQLHLPDDGQPYALVRVHNVTLISSDAAVCVHQRAIPASTNEIGALPELLHTLDAAYGHTALFGRVTTDAGNTSLEAAGQIIGYGWQYFSQIKANNGDPHAEAERVLGLLSDDRATATYGDKQQGKVVTYSVWRRDLLGSGWLKWTHARQLIRVKRVVEDPETGEQRIGNRYYVSSETPQELSAMTCLKISRMHWPVENETHWTADVELIEDRRRHAWSRHPHGLLIVAILRMIAQNILAVARQLSRLGHTRERPSWRDVAQHFLLVLCDSIRQTEAFDGA